MTSACGTGSTAASRARARPQPGLGVDDAVLQPSAAEQVRVGEVGDRVPGCRVLAELLHASQASAATGARDDRSARGDDPTGDLAERDPAPRPCRGRCSAA